MIFSYQLRVVRKYSAAETNTTEKKGTTLQIFSGGRWLPQKF
jgi:hypothetical protein